MDLEEGLTTGSVLVKQLEHVDASLEIIEIILLMLMLTMMMMTRMLMTNMLRMILMNMAMILSMTLVMQENPIR